MCTYLYISISPYVYIYICTYLYISISPYVYIYMYISLYLYIPVCIYIYMYISLYLYIPVCIYIYMYISLYLFIPVCISIYIYISMYISYIHIYMRVCICVHFERIDPDVMQRPIVVNPGWERSLVFTSQHRRVDGWKVSSWAPSSIPSSVIKHWEIQ